MRNLQSALQGLNLLVLALMFVLAGSALAHAEEIYHWVDADGVHHYSQSPPPKASSAVQTLQVDGSQPASYDPAEDRYNLAAQEAAMQALRDKLAESKKSQQQEQKNSAANTIVYYPEPNVGHQIFYPPGYHARPPNGSPAPKPPHRPSRHDGKPDRPGTLPEETPPASRSLKPRP